jgi:hypothetical protein
MAKYDKDTFDLKTISFDIKHDEILCEKKLQTHGIMLKSTIMSVGYKM